MILRKLLLYILFLFIASPLVAADGLFKAGGREAALSNSGLTAQNVWAMFHNPAGLAYINNIDAGIYHEQQFLLKELSTNAFTLGMKVSKEAAVGINATYFGYKLYNEQQAGIAYARKFGEKISAAVKLNYQNIKIGEEYGSKSYVTAEAGLQAQLAKNFWIGAHLYNPTETKLTDEPKENVGSVLGFGAGYIFSEKFNVQTSLEKNSNESALFNAGIEYHPMKQLWLRAGVGSKPLTGTFGFGLAWDMLQFDFATAFHPDLGFTPHLSLTMHFDKK